MKNLILNTINKKDFCNPEDNNQLKNFLKKIILIKKIYKEKQSYIDNQRKLNKLKIEFYEIQNNFKNNIDHSKNELEKNIINKNFKIINPEKVLNYTTKISNNIQGPENYKKNNNLLPWSYNLNVIEINDIELTNLSKTLKGNKNYIKASLPEISNEQMNIQLILLSENKFKINSLEPVNIKLKKNEEKDIILFNKNGEIPTLIKYQVLQNDLLFIPNTCKIKIRVFQIGKLLSDLLTIEVNISNENKKMIQMNEGMLVKPDFDQDMNLDDFQIDFDEIINDDNFQSFKNTGFLSNTPL